MDRGYSVRLRREAILVKMETLAQEAGCGMSTIQRIEKGETVREPTFLKVEAALRRLEEANKNKAGLLSKRDALMFGVYSASAIELSPVALAGVQDDALKEFFRFVDEHKIIDKSSFPAIHMWKDAYKRNADIINKKNLQSWIDEIPRLHSLVSKYAPELLGISLFARACKSGAVRFVTSGRDYAIVEFKLAKTYIPSLGVPEMEVFVDSLINAEGAEQAYEIANIIVLSLYHRFSV